MKKISIFGIFRERSHSPRREFDDEAILRETAKRLDESPELEVHLFHPEEFLDRSFNDNPALIFFMCEEAPYLNKLSQISYDNGCVLVNTVESVENTFRKNMVTLLSDLPFFPRSTLIPTSRPISRGEHGECWLKRGDYHATCDEDVVFVDNDRDLVTGLSRFSARDIDTVLIQEHIPGDIIKFYCIRDCQTKHTWWFKWFYHKDQDLREFGFSESELMDNCIMAGDSMGLDIYGGDAIVTKDGDIFVIDINAWPSFALFRKEAAKFISQLLRTKLIEHLGAASFPGTRIADSLNLSV